MEEMNPENIINETRPMLEELLPQIGISQVDTPVNLESSLASFSHWISEQEISPEDMSFTASLIGAYIIEYLKEYKRGRVTVDGGVVKIVLAIDESLGVYKDFDPYKIAYAIASGKAGDVHTFLTGIQVSNSDDHQ